MQVYLNGNYVDREHASIPVDDRGFIFGDGVYEVTRALRGHLFEGERHFRRLGRGLRGLGITVPAELEQLGEISECLLRTNGLTKGEALVYLQITRGAAPRTHQYPPAGTPPTVYLSVGPFTPPHELRAAGARAITIPDVRWSRCDLKTVNLLPNVMGKQRAVEAGVTEAIFVRDSAVTEGSSTNIFGVVGGELRTYPACNYILGGITRDVVLELAAENNVPVRTTPIFVHELGGVDELFLTSTTNDVMPVVEVDGHPIGGGTPGPITRRLYEAFARRLDRVGG
ncbi:MAG TPA: aminotransferase class IV [Gemmatimonadaceae bacterium]|nr:aminotransferase class IV [Gemmatimonadaceae bacterium]